MSGDVIEQMLETTRRTTNIASRLVQSLEFRNAARPSSDLSARVALAKQLRDSMLRKLDELEQLVRAYQIAEKRLDEPGDKRNRFAPRDDVARGDLRPVVPDAICRRCGKRWVEHSGQEDWCPS